MGKRSKQGLEFFHHLFRKPIVTIKDVQEFTGLTSKASNALVKVFIEKNILLETTGYQRNRVFIFSDYIKIF